MPNIKKQLGKFLWFEFLSTDAKKAQAFYGEVLGWKVKPFPMGDSSYDMIYAGETMIGGYAAPRGAGRGGHWISYVSVADVDAATKIAVSKGGKVVEPPFDAPNVGRMARIADPQGAEFYLFDSATDETPDAEAPPEGGWVWNELHTTDPANAVAFYEAVVGLSHRAMDMGPGGTYYIISKNGVDRGGVTAQLMAGLSPHWLPYVYVEDVDATVARVPKLGGTVSVGPQDIPGVGRFAGIVDPLGGALAVLKPLPRQK